MTSVSFCIALPKSLNIYTRPNSPRGQCWTTFSKSTEKTGASIHDSCFSFFLVGSLQTNSDIHARYRTFEIPELLIEKVGVSCFCGPIPLLEFRGKKISLWVTSWGWLLPYPAVAPQKLWKPGMLRTRARKIPEVSWKTTRQMSKGLGQGDRKPGLQSYRAGSSQASVCWSIPKHRSGKNFFIPTNW